MPQEDPLRGMFPCRHVGAKERDVKVELVLQAAWFASPRCGLATSA